MPVFVLVKGWILPAFVLLKGWMLPAIIVLVKGWMLPAIVLVKTIAVAGQHSQPHGVDEGGAVPSGTICTQTNLVKPRIVLYR